MAKKIAAGKSALIDSTSINEGEVCLAIVPNDSYNERIIDITKEIACHHKTVGYVTLNKPYAKIISLFESKKINPEQFWFIDISTSNAKKGVINVNSLSALTSISIAINKILDQKRAEAMIFDSLSTLLISNDKLMILKFAHAVIRNMKTKKCTGILTILQSDESSETINDIKMFVDKVVYLGKKKK
ncbi:MAG: ATPase domain-containing protein [Nanoarchaeota archaeon]